jgi:hypothetical protein
MAARDGGLMHSGMELAVEPDRSGTGVLNGGMWTVKFYSALSSRSYYFFSVTYVKLREMDCL